MAAEDEETQKRGMVLLPYQVGSKFYAPDLAYILESSKFFQFIPLRIVSVHICMENYLTRLLGRVVMASVTPDVRSKHRLHEGKKSDL